MLRSLIGTLTGSRLARYSGTHRIQGLDGKLSILRDEYAVPHIFAETEKDAFFALGFCQGQDRSFQIELFNRIGRGRLSEWFGAKTVPVDKLSRRINLAETARLSLQMCGPREKGLFQAFSDGINRGRELGLTKRPHEYLIVGKKPETHTPEDALVLLYIMSFLIPNNWDLELVRLKILEADGVEALRALDPSLNFRESDRHALGQVADSVARDLDVFSRWAGRPTGSNNWVVGGKHSATGLPFLANDPHLMPILPAYWYLSHIKTPEFECAGASLFGAPGIVIGHNEHAAWGVTAGIVDNTDFFIEEINEKKEARGPEGWEPTVIRREVIKVKGKRDVFEDVIVTPRGPLVADGFGKHSCNLSIKATWLKPRAVRGILDIHLSKDFSQFRECFDGWGGLSLNYCYAHKNGKIGWQLVGQPPVRGDGNGALPKPAWEKKNLWTKELADFDLMPWVEDPPEGFFATANNRPPVNYDEKKILLTTDWLEPFRYRRITEILAAKSDWDRDSLMAMQQDFVSLPWRELKPSLVTALQSAPEKVLNAWGERLSQWDGVIRPESTEATFFELWQVEMIKALSLLKAPNSLDWAMGAGFPSAALPHNWMTFRRASWLIDLLERRPKNWLKNGESDWDDLIGERALAVLDKFKGDVPGWGTFRPLNLLHPMGIVPGLKSFFNLGPIAYGGDGFTLTQVGVDLAKPESNPSSLPNFRTVMDVSDWKNSRFVLAGGQSGNPVSPHYRDQFELWQKGQGIQIWKSREELECSPRPIWNFEKAI